MPDRPQIEASKAARSFGAVLERVVRGETLEIVRYGRVVAVLAPPPKERRQSRSVQPDKLGSVAPTSLDAVSPSVPRPGVGKISVTTKQQRIDDILRGSRKNG